MHAPNLTGGLPLRVQRMTLYAKHTHIWVPPGKVLHLPLPQAVSVLLTQINSVTSLLTLLCPVSLLLAPQMRVVPREALNR
jgi:hypothetical protein